MRFLILSDIHANIQALDAVLAAALTVGYDQVFVLGDIVGYGGDPAAALARTLALPIAAKVRGNHDKVAAGVEPASGFSGPARAAIEWTTSVLSADDLRALAELPQGPRNTDEDVVICHGAPYDEDAYVFGVANAARALECVSAHLCLFGHTHYAGAFGAYNVMEGDDATLELPRRASSWPTSGRWANRAMATRAPPTGCSTRRLVRCSSDAWTTTSRAPSPPCTKPLPPCITLPVRRRLTSKI